MRYNNNDESLVAETLVTGLIKYNTDESLVTETLVAGFIKLNIDESLVTETLEWKQGICFNLKRETIK
jgi:hypothetical protein